MKISEFLEKYGKKDSPDMDNSIVALLMDDHFYYVRRDLTGYYIKKDIQGLSEEEEELYDLLYSNRE